MSEEETTPKVTPLVNAAVFVHGRRKFKDVNVDITGDKVVVKNMKTGEQMAVYDIVEVVKTYNEKDGQGAAFDVTIPAPPHGDGAAVTAAVTEPIRLVTQLGCGCSGQKPYQPDSGYSGRLKF